MVTEKCLKYFLSASDFSRDYREWEKATAKKGWEKEDLKMELNVVEIISRMWVMISVEMLIC